MENTKSLRAFAVAYFFACGYLTAKHGLDKAVMAKLKDEYEALVKATSVLWHQAAEREHGYGR